MLRTLKILIYMGDLITGKVGVPPAVVCESPLMQARRLLYPLFRPLLRNMSYLLISDHSEVLRKYESSNPSL